MIEAHEREALGKVPQELKDRPSWVVWRGEPKGNGKLTKIPVNPKTGQFASVTDPRTWGTYVEALRACLKNKEDRIRGLGFVFTAKDPFCGVDLDNSISGDGKPNLQTQAYVDQLWSYTEITPSRRGLHVLLRGRLPGRGRKRGSIEIYDQARFFTITGAHLSGTPTTIEHRQKELETFYQNVFGKEEKPKPIETKPTLLSDKEALEKASNAKNGDKFNQLWTGVYSEYPSQSEADLALCFELAFWCGNNPEQIDQLFRQSGLYRKKWDEKHGNMTYGQLTIRKAVEYTSEVYSPTDSLVQDERADPDYSAEIIHETELGNAMRLVGSHGENIRYCHAWHKWLIWDGKRWKVDDQGKIKRKAKDTILKIHEKLSRCPDKESRQRLFKHAIKSEADAKIKAMLSLAESEPGIPVTPDDLDKDPWILNCDNGILDLKTGILKRHDRSQLITKICPVAYSKEAECPKWKKFLNTIMDKNQGLIKFIQRAVGYSLTGSATEQCLFFLYGTGANGKSTFLEVILTLLSDYARRSDFSTFLVKYSDSIRNDLARLKGARFVSAIETSEGKRLAEGIIKQLTGGDRIAARFLHREYFEFMPEFKIWLAANHKPLIRGTDYAIWRRIRVIPFAVTIPDKIQNPNLADELKEELPGILTWAVQGSLMWLKEGLKDPKEVKAATAKYKDDMDILGDFIKDCCILDTDIEISKGELYGRYCAWCEKTGEKGMSSKKMGMRLLERGFEERTDGKRRYWIGIRLRK